MYRSPVKETFLETHFIAREDSHLYVSYALSLSRPTHDRMIASTNPSNTREKNEDQATKKALASSNVTVPYLPDPPGPTAKTAQVDKRSRFRIVDASSLYLAGGGVFGDGLCALGDGVLGKFAR